MSIINLSDKKQGIEQPSHNVSTFDKVVNFMIHAVAQTASLAMILCILGAIVYVLLFLATSILNLLG